MSEAESSTGNNVHLLVLVHGMWGNPGHLASMQQVYDEVRGVTNPDADAGPAGEHLHIIVPETNKEAQTYDGMDWGGERVALEVSFLSCSHTKLDIHHTFETRCT